ncbi:MAG: penicillin-binding protein activator, partial [Nitrospirota bacterium]
LEAARRADAAGDDARVIELVQQWLKAQAPPDVGPPPHAGSGPGPAGPPLQPSESAAEALYLIGKASARLQQTNEAIGYLKKLLKEMPASPWAAEASALLGGLYGERGSTAEAISYLEKAASLLRSPERRRALYERLAALYRQSGNLPKAVETLLALRRLAETSGDQAEAAALIEQIDGLIAQETNAGRLERIVASAGKRFPADAAILRLAALAADRREPYDEEQWLTRFLEDFPRHSQASAAADRLRANAAAIKAKSAVVGILLPLSGPARLFGHSALRGAEIALEGQDAVGMTVRDSHGADVEAWQEWIDDFEPVAVVGPLLTREMERAAPLAERRRVPLVNPGAPIGPAAPAMEDEARGYLFWNGLTLAEQARAAADYAVTGQARMRFMALYPDASYARTATEIFAARVRQLGGEVIAAITYPPGSTDFSAPLRALRTADLARYGTAGPPIEGKPPDEWPYTPGFDAIFLPGGAEAAGMIASQLAFHGFDGIQLLGAGDWNRPELFAYGGRFVEGAVLASGFFAQSAAPHVREFVRRYQMRYHGEPDLFAAQAYDAMRMVLSAIAQGARDGEEVRDYLSGMKDYPGVTGATTLVPGAPALKQPFLMQIHNGKLVPLQGGAS